MSLTSASTRYFQTAGAPATGGSLRGDMGQRVSGIHPYISLRGTYEKHLIMSDGSSMAVEYNEPVHYEKDGHTKALEFSKAYNLELILNIEGLDLTFQ